MEFSGMTISGGITVVYIPPPTYKAIFGYGYGLAATAITNLVSNTGVVATDTAGVGTNKTDLAAATYGYG